MLDKMVPNALLWSIAMKWEGDAQLGRMLRAPMVGDLLDALGYRHHFLPPGIRSLRPGMKMAGWAIPIQNSGCVGVQERSFGRLAEALDQIKLSFRQIWHPIRLKL